MSEDFGGVGGPPARSGGGGGGGKSSPFPEFGFDEPCVIKLKNGESKNSVRRLWTWRVAVGEAKRRILMLDPHPTKEQPRQAAFLWDFTGADGKFGNRLVSRCMEKDGKTDPLSGVLGRTDDDGAWREDEPRWHWLLTGIDLTTTKSKKGKVYEMTRMVVLVPEVGKDQLLLAEKLLKGLRGRIFEVSRNAGAANKTPRIGNKWDPTGGDALTDAQMMAMVEKSAEVAGMTPAQYLAPVDYPSVFRPKSYEELSKIAGRIKSPHTVTAGGPPPGHEPVEGMGEQEQELPY